MSGKFIAGIDIGGSHITVALIDVEKRQVLEPTRKRTLINSQESADKILKTWVQTIKSSFAELGLLPNQLAIAMPGPFDYAVGISLMKGQNKFDALYGLNIKELLAKELQLNPSDISFANDAACFLQGELFGGVAQGYQSAFGLTLGTGFGSARAINGFAEDADLWCAPFKTGIAEDFLSGRWITQRYQELTGNDIDGVKQLIEDDKSNNACHTVFKEFGNNLGQFLSPYLKADNTELVVIGGSIAQCFSLFSSALEESLNSNSLQVKIEKTTLGENAAMLGAASFSLIKPVQYVQ